MVAERAPDGFARLGDVVPPGELRAVIERYSTLAGFDRSQVNR